MVEVEYVGPLGEVTVPSIGATVAAGGTVKVSAEVAASLLEQVDNWRPVAAAKGDKGKGDA